jgi:uncharacterized membrane protein
MIAILGMLTALYVVLSAFLKFTLFSNIMVDLGYIVFTVALCMYGIYGTVVGVIGCALESILFSAYGFSISWVLANLAIGLIAAGTLHKNVHTIAKCTAIMFAVGIGMILVKTSIECYLYSIPLVVKIPKNTVAFAADATTMIAGLAVYRMIEGKVKGVAK